MLNNITLTQAIEKAKEECPDPYAQAYLRSIPQSIIEYGIEGLKAQLLYCLNNMQYWRGETAREVKKIFRDRIKEL